MHVGDMFLGKTLPFIDAENGNGGSAIEFGRTLTKVIDTVRDVDTIINGHCNTPLSWSDLVDYRGFYTDLYDQTRQSLDTGLSADEAIAAYDAAIAIDGRPLFFTGRGKGASARATRPAPSPPAPTRQSAW